MDKGIFTDHAHLPTEEEIRSALGSVYVLWERLVRFMEADERIEGKFSFWGPAKSGWGLRFRKRGKALLALYPHEKKIMVQIVLGRTQAEKALELKLGEKVSQMLNDSPQQRDGKWLAIPVVSKADAEDVEQLLQLKMQK